MATSPPGYNPPLNFPSPFTIENPGGGATDHAYLEVKVSGAAGGDPHIRFTIPGGTSWYCGPDNSDSDIFKIGVGTAVGTTPKLSVTSAGVVTITGGDNAGFLVHDGTNPVGQLVTSSDDVYFDAIKAAKALVFRSNGFTECFRANGAAHLVMARRLQGRKGADVASATTITLGGDGNFFDITGTTQIDFIAVTDWQAGSVVILQFDAGVTVRHNQAGTGPILLSGAANLAATAGDLLQLVFNGTQWEEVSRTIK